MKLEYVQSVHIVGHVAERVNNGLNNIKYCNYIFGIKFSSLTIANFKLTLMTDVNKCTDVVVKGSLMSV